jgi:hypothetical protein
MCPSRVNIYIELLSCIPESYKAVKPSGKGGAKIPHLPLGDDLSPRGE